MHKNMQMMFDQHARPCFRAGMRVLEIGPITIPSPFERSVGIPGLQWDTLDIVDNPKLTYPRAPQHQLPVPDSSYDVIFSSSVIEHVRKIWIWVRELERACKPGGLVIILSPVSWPYHEAPIDCWRIYPEGMRALLEDTSLEIQTCEFGSLEAPGYRRYRPGISFDSLTSNARNYYKLVGMVGMPVERAYDLITIARKRT